MHLRLRSFAEQLLIVANIFIAFLLIFDNKLVIPPLLQAFGRLHPLILHFPIVLLVLAMLMEFFRFRYEYVTNAFYRNFLRNLILIGALLAAITVVMGIFLSQEEGYTAQTLMLHKWTGAALFFLSSIIYWARNTVWYKAPVAKASVFVLLTVLVLTGHYGAVLTHGDNFIWQPLSNAKEMAAVPIEEAEVYANVIRPILEHKCTSCHNPDKIKGGLILSDPVSIQKGGKSGNLIIPGNSELSLLLQRVHLPIEEKKHMPPSGKSQLTAQEIILLEQWINKEASFTSKVMDLAPTDSLRIFATTYLDRGKRKVESYDFTAVDDAIIEKLNTDYRTILPIARQSPALAVNIYNSATFSKKQLEELVPIKKNIVSLNLNKMPVKDVELETIAVFENLRHLKLNFTEITASGLKSLSILKYLESLTLSGTKVKFNELNAVLPNFKGLKTISVWDTGLTSEEIAQLKLSAAPIDVIAGYRDDGSNSLKLNPPQVKNVSVIFGKSLTLDLFHPIKGVNIHFTMDNSEPDSVNGQIFEHKSVIKKSETVKAKAYKEGWLGSDAVTFYFFKSQYKPDSVSLLQPLNTVHQAEGARTFFDHKLGAIGANNPAWANNWAGVRNNDIVLVAEFKTPIPLSSVGVHYMVEEATGIFPPEIVEVWGGSDINQLKLLTQFKALMPIKGEMPSLRTVEGTFKPQNIRYLKIVARPLTKIPAWHNSKGNRALLLVDEMFLN